MNTATPFTGFVQGRRLAPASRIVERENPGRLGRIAARWHPASPEDARAAMDAAQAAFPGWSATPPATRLAILQRLPASIEADSGTLADLITRENGKTRRESLAEVQAALNDARFLISHARASADESTLGTRGRLLLEPVGAFLLITPWNFPFATIVRKLVPALAWGNTAVVKPSELTPGPACRLFELIAATGLPPGVASLLLGYGSEIGEPLISHPALRGISFTGSTRVGTGIAASVAGRDVRLQMEMGGKNSLVVLGDADVDLAVRAAIVGGFSCAGQWCTGTGRVIVDASVHDAFCKRLADQAASLHVGPGDHEASQVGPLSGAESVVATTRAIGEAVASGARILCGGTALAHAGGASGHYFAPTVLDGVTDAMRVMTDELFAPVLPVCTANNDDDAVRLANLGRYGLTASVYSRNLARARSVARRIESGIVHVNLHTAYREPALPVAAWRDSGRGYPEGGRYARDFFTRPRAWYEAEATDK